MFLNQTKGYSCIPHNWYNGISPHSFVKLKNWKFEEELKPFRY